MWYYCNYCSYYSSRHVYFYLVGGPLAMSCGNCGSALNRPSANQTAAVDRFTKKHVVNQWQTFESEQIAYSCLVVSPAQPIGFAQTAQSQPAQSSNAPQQLSPQLGSQVSQPSSSHIGSQPSPQQLSPQIAPQTVPQIGPQTQIGPQIGPQMGQSSAAPSRVFAVSNQSATDTEILIGKYLLLELEDEGVTKVECASELKNSRSGDYRLHYRDGSVLPADLYECGTSNIQNAVSYIQSKWDQADTIVVLLPKISGLNYNSVIAELQKSSAPTSMGIHIIPRRVLFVKPNSLPGLPPEFCFDMVKLHSFYTSPQTSVFKRQLQ